MGSSGTGKFSDYSTTQNMGGSGASGEDRCIINAEINLEEIERCEYFSSQKSLPAIGSQVDIGFSKRIFASVNGLVVGYLSTEFNFLLACMNSGYKYTGVIISTTEEPLLRVKINITSI